jgi:hypothetical protein
MLRSVKRFVRLLLNAALLPAGWIVFGVAGRTPPWAGMSLIRMFCASGGRSNDVMADLISIWIPPRPIIIRQGVLPAFTGKEIADMAAKLRERGFCVPQQRVPEDICDRLLRFALSRPAMVRPGDGQERKSLYMVYDPKNPVAVRYDFEPETLIDHPDVQALMADPAIVSLAQTYLRTEPVADVISMWWHTAFSDRPDSEAAQYYHFDLDRIKWLKFFIYLTDVGPENGPHKFIAGSHRTGGIPGELLKKGYARLTDEEVAPHYRPADFIEFTAPRGTIIAEDTRGLHKGQHVNSGHRLMLQIQFSNSLFGPPYPKISFGLVQAPQIIEMQRLHPRIYSAFRPQRVQS